VSTADGEGRLPRGAHGVARRLDPRLPPILGGLPIVLGFVLWNTRGTGLLAQIRRPYAGWQARGWALMNGVSGPGIGVACYQWALSTQPAAVVLQHRGDVPVAGAALPMGRRRPKPGVRVWVGGGLAVAGGDSFAQSGCGGLAVQTAYLKELRFEAM
jgi:hypothetical protein